MKAAIAAFSFGAGMADDFATLQTKLHSLRTDTLQKAQRKALRAVGEYIKEEYVSRAPEKAESARGVLEQGELKASVGIRVSVPTDEGILQGKIAKVSVGPRGEQAKLIAADVEYGHTNPTAKPGKLAFTPAHPFVRPTEEATEATSIEVYVESVTADIEKAMK